MPIFILHSLFCRFYRTISVSELYHMKDTVEIKEQSGKGRMVCLQTTLAAMPLNQFSCGDPGKALSKVNMKCFGVGLMDCKYTD